MLQSKIGSKKGEDSLYVNAEKEKDGNETGRYFVGINGDVGEFMKTGRAANELADLVQNKNIVEFGLTSRNLAQYGGAVTFDVGEITITRTFACWSIRTKWASRMSS